jgi:tripartite-type tricarboxylate transporter receptor subunit TctC
MKTLIALLCVLSVAIAPAWAQRSDYPSKPIHILVPFTPGGTADVLARAIGQQLTASWGEQVVVENRGGAGGTIGMDAAKRLPADGHNLVLISNSQAVSQVIYPKLNHDMTKDFTPVMLIGSSAMIIAAHPRLGIGDFPSLVKQVRAQPGRLTYASCGNGTAHHLAMEKIKSEAKLAIVHIPYRGCGPAVIDAVGGQVDLLIASAPPVLPHMQSGKLRGLAVTNDRRSASAPQIATVAESGVPALKGFAVDNWYGLMAPLGTPAPIVARLEAEIRKIMRTPAMTERLSAAGIETKLGNGNELMAALRADIAQFKAVADFAKITPQ